MSQKTELFVTFLKIGAFTFGGGYAMIPLIEREVAEKKHWITSEEILEVTAIAESTPGPIAINAATFIGYRIAGFAGAFLATFGVVLPSFLIIFGISFILRQFEQAQAVRYAFWGIRAGVLALIVKAMVSMYRQAPKGLLSYLMMGGALAAVALCRVNVILVIAVCALVGILAGKIAVGRSRKE